MKTYFLINSLKAGGAERQIAETADYLKGKGYDVEILTIEGGMDYDVSVPVNYIHERNFLLKLTEKIFPPKVSNLLKTIVAPGKISTIISNGDLVLSYLFRSNLTALELKKREIAKKVVIADGIAPSKQYNRLQLQLLKKYIKYADAGIFNSKWIAYEYQKLGIEPDKTLVIHNARDIKGIREKMNEEIEKSLESIFRNHKVVIHVGRFHKQKNHEALVKAMAYLRKIHPGIYEEAHLVLIGTGPLLPKVKKLAQEMELENKITFLGLQKNPFKYMKRSYLLALPSLWEGLPNVVIESLAVGLPVVATDCRSGPREILAPKTDFTKQAKSIETVDFGILTPVEPKDRIPEYIAEAIAFIFKDEKLHKKLSQAGFKRAEDFSMEKIGPKWEEVINSFQ